jgi:lipid kinase YegS
MIRIILNGKKADLDEVRGAVAALRSESSQVEVRVTWERGDAVRFVKEAVSDKIGRVVAAGGDGTINEVVNGLAQIPRKDRPVLAILPLGTANDFATACAIPSDPVEALSLALHGRAFPVDIGRANQRYFINVATGGFVSQVTSQVPSQVKNFIGGSAYALAAIMKSLSFEPSRGRLKAEGIELSGTAISGAVCNGRQAGGGKVLAPEAYINDGLFDIMVILTFPLSDIGQVIQEIFDPSSGDGKYVRRFRSRWVESWPEARRSVNLDGEPFEADHIRFDVLPGEIDLVLPEGCPCLI